MSRHGEIVSELGLWLFSDIKVMQIFTVNKDTWSEKTYILYIKLEN